MAKRKEKEMRKNEGIFTFNNFFVCFTSIEIENICFQRFFQLLLSLCSLDYLMFLFIIPFLYFLPFFVLCDSFLWCSADGFSLPFMFVWAFKTCKKWELKSGLRKFIFSFIGFCLNLIRIFACLVIFGCPMDFRLFSIK